MTTAPFSLMPIGGVQEIGSNMTLIKTEQEEILIDCGMLFPYEDCFDIRYLIPSFDSLDTKKLSSIIITHGHEDHIGALPHLIQKFPDIKIYASNFTFHLIRKKFEQFNLKLNIEIYDEKSLLIFKDIHVTPCLVNHSIPETFGLVIKDLSDQWGILYISDFKVDLTSQHEKPFEIEKIQNLLKNCVQTAFFLDSTNILNEEKTPSENELEPDLLELLQSASSRVFVTLFASNIHRIQTILELASKTNRKIILMGRSIKTYLEAAYESGLIQTNHHDFLTPDQVSGEDHKILVLVSGCQGDYLSALRRFSFGEDSHFRPRPDDLVVFSSKIIPGNEKKIYRIYNKLTEFGAQIATASDYLIHASGHPGKKDIEILLDHICPHFYFPIHGESYFLKKHHDFISYKYPQIRPYVITNYQEVIFKNKDLKIVTHDKKEPVIIHGKGIIVERSDISKRRKMATTGSIFLSYYQKLNQYQISFLGIPLTTVESHEPLKDKLLKRLDEEMRKNLSSRDPHYQQEQLRILTRQFMQNHLGYKPVTEVHLWP